MPRFETAGVIINQVLAEVGLEPVNDPFTSSDAAVRQLTYLITTVGRQLVHYHPWEHLQRELVIVTAEDDEGRYELPVDFGRMFDQTGWSRDQRVPLPGSVSGEAWQYLRGRNLVSSTIYMVFREIQGELWVYPQPPDAPVPAPLTIAFEYLSRYWAVDADTVGTENPQGIDRVRKAGDLINYVPSLVTAFLKLKFREARGADTTAAQNEFLREFAAVTAQDVAAMNLNLAQVGAPYPYIDGWRNLPDSGYGLT